MFSGPNKVVEVADDFPIGMWTTPEVGYYGMTKQAAIKAGFDAEEGIAQYDKCLRGRVFAPDGMLKLVFDRESKRILGVHIIGTDACELVHYGMDLVEKQATIFDVIGTLFTAVTFHELFKEAGATRVSSSLFLSLRTPDPVCVVVCRVPRLWTGSESKRQHA
jgi:pyruvate/2-oxoglutarate dehydrogenase complex dihydrolipoamide dehydrogenase (E3) component